MVVFLRGGQPVLYDGENFCHFFVKLEQFLVAHISTTFAGPANEEVLLQWLMQCREPSVQHLTDSTFEHLTQVRNLTCVRLNRAGGGEIARK